MEHHSIKDYKDPNGRSLADFSKEELAEMYITKNMTSKQIAKLFNAPMPTVIALIERLGLVKTKEQKAAGTRKRRSESNGFLSLSKEEIKDLYITQNLSAKQIADRFGIKVCAVYEEIHRQGISKPRALGLVHQHKTNKERYGVENTFQSPSFREKSKETLIKKYGVDNPMKVPSIHKKAEQTCLDRYGVDNVFKSAVFQAKAQETCFDKYGVPFSAQSPLCRAKVEDTCSKRYGAPNPFGSPVIQQKAMNTIMDKYGVSSIMQNAEIRKRVQKTNAERYDPVKNPDAYRQVMEKRTLGRGYSEKTARLMATKQSLSSFLSSFHSPNTKSGKPTAKEAAFALECSYQMILEKTRKWGLRGLLESHATRSLQEISLANRIRSWGVPIKTNIRGLLPNHLLEIDIFIPSRSLGIEYDGDFWHSEINQKLCDMQKKNKLGQEANIFIYHISSREWNDMRRRQIIIDRLKFLTGTYGVLEEISVSDCHIVNDIPFSVVNDFYARFGLLWKKVPQETIGLESKDGDLLCLAQKNLSHGLVLDDFAYAKGVDPDKGFARLISLLRIEYNEIIIKESYAKSNPFFFLNQGFDINKISSPSFFWENFTNYKIQEQTENCTKEEVRFMHSKGYVRVFDAGEITYSLSR